MAYEQAPPFAIQIELVEGCPLSCSFCALQVIRDNGADWRTGTHGKNSTPYKFMDLDTLKAIVKDIAHFKWKPRLELAMHGEPSMHPKLVECVRLIKNTLPDHHLMMTSNGAAFVRSDKIKAVFEAGLNTLALDDYDHAGLIERVINALEDSEIQAWLDAQKIRIYFYPDDKDGNPHRRLKKGERMITVVKDITQAHKGTHSLVTNQGGNVGKPDPSMADKRCAKPFRELSFRWDGNVAICCDDWTGSYKIGNIHDFDITELWQHPRFYAARQRLLYGHRDFGPCKGCNVRSYRPGLLPDQRGKAKMPKPNAQTDDIIKDALSGKPYSKRVR